MKACFYPLPPQANLAAILVSLLAMSAVPAQTARETVLEVTASTRADRPHITLSWLAPTALSTTNNTRLWRRVQGEPSWGAVTYLPLGATSYADTDAEPGVVYEYSLQATRTAAPTTVYGAIAAGFDIPIKERRGHVILLVDDTISQPLAPELERMEHDLAADGWEVHRQDVPREQIAIGATGTENEAARLTERVAIRRIIQDFYATAPDEEWSLLLFGRVPVVYSGSTGPDGHGPRAWPTDAYYADIDGKWNDTNVNSTYWSDPAFQNTRGDGKFDPSTLPSDVELCTGRVDLHKLNSIPVGISETEKLRRYLVRDHQFRRKLPPYDNVAQKLVVDDDFGYFSGEAFSSSGWRAGIAFFGNHSSAVSSAAWFSTLSQQPVMLAYGCGAGSYTTIEGVGTSVDFGTRDSKAVFNMLFGSYFGSWDTTNSVLRAPLAGTADSLGLTSVWSGRGYFHLQHMALGETIGYSTRFTQNNSDTPSSGGWFQNARYRAITYNLLGDPTLRLHPILPPTDVSAVSTAAGVTLEWNASADAALGYHVYRGASPAGPFVRLTGVAADASNPDGSPVTGMSWTDTTAVAGETYTWLVKAVRRETSASGTYINQSLGEAVTLTCRTSALSAPVGLTVTATGAGSRALSWSDTSGGSASTVIERYDPTDGLWQTIATLEPGLTAYTDADAPVGGVSGYRVRAENNEGVSAWSEMVEDASLAGLATYSTVQSVVNRNDSFPLPRVRRVEGAVGDVSVHAIVNNLFNPMLKNGDLEAWDLTGDHPEPKFWSLSGEALPEPAPGLVNGSAQSAWVPAGYNTYLFNMLRKQPEVFDLEYTFAATDPGSSTSRSMQVSLYSWNPSTSALTILINLRTVRGSSAGWLDLEAYDGSAWRNVATNVCQASVYDRENKVFTELHPLTVRLAVDFPNATYQLQYGVPGETFSTLTLAYFHNQPGPINGTRLLHLYFSGNHSTTGFAVDEVRLYSRDGTASDFDPVTLPIAWPHGDSADQELPLELSAASSTVRLSDIYEFSLDKATNGLGTGYPDKAYLFVRDPDAAALPAPWSTQAIGPELYDAGYGEFADGAFGLKVRTTSLYGSSDSLRLISRPVTGDFQFTARLHMDAALVNMARMGLMVRTSLNANAAMDSVLMEPPILSTLTSMNRCRRASTGASLSFVEYRSANFPHPIWLRMVRSGNTMTTYFSRDGESFKPFSSAYTLGSAGDTLYACLAANSATPASLGVELGTYVRFDLVTVYTLPSVPANLTVGSGSGSITLSWDADEAATAYRVERLGPDGVAYTEIAEVDTTSWTDTGLDPADTYTYRVYALNPAYTSAAAEVSAQPGPLSGYDAWAAIHAFANPVEASHLMDPDGDGLTNLQEYAFGHAPLVSDSDGAWDTGLTNDGRYLTLTFKRISDPDLCYTVEATGNLLSPWISIWSSTGSANLAETVTVTEPLDSCLRRFLRLRIELSVP